MNYRLKTSTNKIQNIFPDKLLSWKLAGIDGCQTFKKEKRKSNHRKEIFNQGLICKTRKESPNATETTSQKVLSQNLFQFTKYVLIIHTS